MSASPRGPLAVIGTHPVQYQAPVYAAVERCHGIPVRAIYGSDYSIAGGFDQDFQTSVTWDNFQIDPEATTFLSSIRPEMSGRTVGLDKALAAAHPSAVLLTGYQPFFHLRAFWETKRRHYPVLFRAETTDDAVKRSPLKSWLRDSLLRLLYAGCDRLLPIGSRSYRHYRRLGCPQEKLVMSPYCVDTRVFQQEEHYRQELRRRLRLELEIADDRTVLLFSGKLGARKAPHLLIEAVRHLPAEQRGRMVLLFLGSGPEQQNLVEAAAREPRVAAHFAGFQNQSRVSPYYHAADLFVLPSNSETWGLVVNEALHHGLPCVVTEAVGCAADLIEPGVTGEICATGDAASLAAALKRAAPLVGDPAVRAKCRAKISGFTVERAAEGIARAYWSVVGTSR
jgi:glycosyltransferase involved in cell wall biosynthesis